MITEDQVYKQAEIEGWGIFNGDTEIQTLDLGPEEGPNKGVPQFATDQAALCHVLARAAEGSELHKKALEMIGYEPDAADGPLYQLEIIETIQRTRIYVVEAKDATEAEEKARVGITIEEQGDELQILGRKIVAGPTLLTHQQG